MRDLLATIGVLPMVELPHLAPSPRIRLFAKLEAANPTGSVKDRIAHTMVADARASGALQPGQTILEPSSGNTGISLAWIGRQMGHPVRVVMPDNTTVEREQLLRLYGAEIIPSPGDEGSNGAIRLAQELATADPSLFMPYQYGNLANPRAHEEGTGPEILAEVPELDLFVAGLGTGGTITGVGRFLKRERPGARVVAAEPLPGEQVQGLRSLDEGFVPPVLDASVLDDRYLVSNRWSACDASCTRRASSPACPPGRRCTSPSAQLPRWRWARSSCCWPTAAGNTSRPESTTATLTSWTTSWSARCCGERSQPAVGDGRAADGARAS
jgi:[CysO sulfur-carrier protein]-thiocarboxylate-dependent cysteine synthase